MDRREIEGALKELVRAEFNRGCVYAVDAPDSSCDDLDRKARSARAHLMELLFPEEPVECEGCQCDNEPGAYGECDTCSRLPRTDNYRAKEPPP